MQGHPPFSSRTPSCRFQRSSAPVSSANRAPCQPVFAASQRASAESTSRRRQRQKHARLHAGADAGTDRRHAVRTRRELGTNPDEAWTATAVLVCGPLALPVQPCTLSAPPRCHRLLGWQTPQPCPPTPEPCLLADKLAGRRASSRSASLCSCTKRRASACRFLMTPVSVESDFCARVPARTARVAPELRRGQLPLSLPPDDRGSHRLGY
jgi:hypothetical protein